MGGQPAENVRRDETAPGLLLFDRFASLLSGALGTGSTTGTRARTASITCSAAAPASRAAKSEWQLNDRTRVGEPLEFLRAPNPGCRPKFRAHHDQDRTCGLQQNQRVRQVSSGERSVARLPSASSRRYASTSGDVSQRMLEVHEGRILPPSGPVRFKRWPQPRFHHGSNTACRRVIRIPRQSWATPHRATERRARFERA